MSTLIMKRWKCPYCNFGGLLTRGTIRFTTQLIDEQGKSHRLDIPALEVFICKCGAPVFTEETDIAILKEYKNYMKEKNDKHSKSA